MACWRQFVQLMKVLAAAFLTVGLLPVRASLETYDNLITQDALGGLTPVARLSSPVVFSGTNRAAFNFGTNSGNATFEFILEGNPAPSTSAYLAVGENTASNLRYELAGNTGQLGFTQLGILDYLFNPGVASPTQATHIAYTWNGETRTMKLYRNGVLAGSRTGVDAAFGMPRGQGWLGANPNNTENMTGTIYRVTAFEGLVSEEVIQGHADAFIGMVRAPVVVSFAATPSTIFTPSSATLNWNVRNATSVFINGNEVTSQSNLVVVPSLTTTYTLLATNTAGANSNSVTVVVNPAPLITSFKAIKTYLAVGESTTLSWNVVYANQVAILPGIGNVLAVGSTNVRSTGPITYTLSATNAFGIAGGQLIIHLVQPANHVVISEFLANDQSILADEDGDSSGWIELHNPTSRAANLAGHFLSDDRGNPTKWGFPAINLEPGMYLVVFASGKNRTNAYAPLHTSFRLNNAGEYLALVGPGPVVLHAFDPAYPPQRADIAYGLLGDDVSLARYLGVPTPGIANQETPPPPAQPEFTPAGGVFTAPFELTLKSLDPGVEIYYTLDGSAPSPSSSSRYTGPITISGTAHVRAISVLDGGASKISGASFVRLASELANYTSSLPIMIIHNFGAGMIPQKGWTASGEGIRQVHRQTAAWATFERSGGGSAFTNTPQMVSLIGVRGRGAYSTQWRQKPYSIEAMDEEGAEADVAPLGMSPHPDWVLYFPDADQNKDPSLLYKTFAHELSQKIGHYSVRFRWVEAFINEGGGDLTLADRRGVYALLEKVSRGKSRLDFEQFSADAKTGGWLLDINRMDPEPEDGWPAPNGANRPWFFHTAGANRLVETTPDTSYGAVPGDDQPRQWNAYFNFDNPNGYVINTPQRAAIEGWFKQFEDVLYNNVLWRDPVNGYYRYIDQQDFIDYFILNVMTRAGDGLLISLYPWKGNDGRLRMGPVWDNNGSAYYTSGAPSGSLLYRSDRLWYARFFADQDFVQAYIDRWWDLRRGSMDNAALQTIVDSQAADISAAKALLNGVPSAIEWTNRLGQMKTWLTQHADWIDGNYLRPPTFNQPGGTVPDGFVAVITGTNGTIYVSTDGTDPRARGGAVAATAEAYAAPITLRTPTLVQARIKNGTNWSGLTTALFRTPQDLTPLVVTEIMYNPPAFGSWISDDLEFLELKNTGTNSLNLGGLLFTAGISFTFPVGTILPPGEFFLLVRNAAAFAAKYPGVPVGGVYSGRLDNGGETLRLAAGEGTVFEFSYGDRAPWPLSCDGYGFSLVAEESVPEGNSGSGAYWRASSVAGGSPGRDDPSSTAIPVVINEIVPHTNPPDVDAIELFNPATTDANLSGWFLSDDGVAPKKFRIPNGTIVPAGGYWVFTEAEFNPTPGTALNFALNSSGDAIYLTAADTVGDLTGYGHGVDFGAASQGASFGRYLNSMGAEHFPAQVRKSLGARNVGPFVGPVVFTKIMYNPDPGGDQFVELRNISGQEVPLFDPAYPTNTWELAGLGYRFPANIVVPPNGLVLVVGTNPAVFRAKYGVADNVQVLGPAAGSLQNGGERLQLMRPDAPDTNGVPYICVEEVRYDQKAPWPPEADGGGASLQRLVPSAYGNDPTNWAASFLAPGQYPVGGDAPVILTKPASQEVVRGGNVTFSVVVTNTASLPLAYFWFENDALLSNSVRVLNEHSSFLTISNARLPYTNYTLLVTNFAGVTSTFDSAASITFLADSDGDGLPDAWETSHGLRSDDPTDASMDSDGDGLSNLQEYLAGTDPRDPLSYLKILSISRDNVANIVFEVLSNKTYSVEYCAAPDMEPWKKLVDVSAQSTNRQERVSDPDYATNRFYRLVTPRQP